jgi:hypothetical protein
MPSAIVTFILDTLWPILPQVTVGLRFVTAMVGFILTINLLLRLARRSRRRVVRRANRRR